MSLIARSEPELRAMLDPVIDFFKSNKILSRAWTQSDVGCYVSRYKITSDLAAALQRGEREKFYKIYTSEGAKVCQAIDATYDSPTRQLIMKMKREVKIYTNAAIPERYLEVRPIGDTFFDHGIDISLSKCLPAASRNAFFDEIFEIYRLGAWPCGFDGEGASGKFSIFVPT